MLKVDTTNNALQTMQLEEGMSSAPYVQMQDLQGPLAGSTDSGPVRAVFALDQLQPMDPTEMSLLEKTALKSGATRAEVHASAGKLEVDLPALSLTEFSGALARAGFRASLMGASPLQDDGKTSPPSSQPPTIATLKVSGMTCAACVKTVENAISGVDGVSSVSVNLLSHRAEVEFRHPATAAECCDAADCIGFECEVLQETNPDKKEPAQFTATMRIEGMTCAACVGTVERAALMVDGVLAASVSLLAHRAEIRFQEPAEAASIAEGIEDIGFGAEVLQVSETGSAQEATDRPSELRVALKPGIDQSAFRQAALKTGAVECVFFIRADRARLMYWPAKLGARDLLRLFSPYCEYVTDEAEEDPSVTAFRSLKRNTSLSLLPTLLVVLLTEKVIEWPWNVEICCGLPVAMLMILPLTFGVQFVCGRLFHGSAIAALCHFTFTMNTLVSLSTTASFCYGFFACIAAPLGVKDFSARMAAMFCETSTVLISVLLCGRVAEASAKVQTTKAVRDLQAQRPTTAILVDPEASPRRRGSSDKLIPYDLIQVGDILRVLPGEAVPADGEVVSEDVCFCDESLLTGEADPVRKGRGARVVGGSTALQGSMLMESKGVGNSSTLARIVHLVEAAQAKQPSVQRFVDKVASYFTPIILVIALATLIFWSSLAVIGEGCMCGIPMMLQGTHGIAFAVTRVVSVLSIACPCSLGLATPTAIMVATGLAAKSGCLVKDATVWERVRKLTTAVLDKTGTLTEGKPQVVSVALLPDLAKVPNFDQIPCVPGREAKVLGQPLTEAKGLGWPDADASARLGWLLHGAEADSEHPLSQAIVKWCKAVNRHEPGDALDFMNLPGRGITCNVNPVGAVAVGSLSFVGVSTDGPAGEWAKGRQSEGCIVIGLQVAGLAVALLALRDELQPDAAHVVASLQQRGITVWMCTGDQVGTARAVAQRVGIQPENVRAQCLPDAKAKLVEELAQSSQVVMVGDGLNDAAAMASASMGIAIGAGSHVTVDSAQVVLTQSRLGDVLVFLKLGNATMRTVYRNFAWALIFNVIGVPLAAGLGMPWGYMLPPIACGLAMASSSVIVITSSLMLRCFHRPRSSGKR